MRLTITPTPAGTGYRAECLDLPTRLARPKPIGEGGSEIEALADFIRNLGPVNFDDLPREPLEINGIPWRREGERGEQVEIAEAIAVADKVAAYLSHEPIYFPGNPEDIRLWCADAELTYGECESFTAAWPRLRAALVAATPPAPPPAVGLPVEVCEPFYEVARFHAAVPVENPRQPIVGLGSANYLDCRSFASAVASARRGDGAGQLAIARSDVDHWHKHCVELQSQLADAQSEVERVKGQQANEPTDAVLFRNIDNQRSDALEKLGAAERQLSLVARQLATVTAERDKLTQDHQALAERLRDVNRELSGVRMFAAKVAQERGHASWCPALRVGAQCQCVHADLESIAQNAGRDLLAEMEAKDKRIAELEADRKRLNDAIARESGEIEQVLGKALDYPPLYPEASGVDDGQVGVGDNVPVTLAMEAAAKIRELEAKLKAAEPRVDSELREWAEAVWLAVAQMGNKLIGDPSDEQRAACGRLMVLCSQTPWHKLGGRPKAAEPPQPDPATVAASMAAIDEGRTKPIQKVIDGVKGAEPPQKFIVGDGPARVWLEPNKFGTVAVIAADKKGSRAILGIAKDAVFRVTGEPIEGLAFENAGKVKMHDERPHPDPQMVEASLEAVRQGKYVTAEEFIEKRTKAAEQPPAAPDIERLAAALRPLVDLARWEIPANFSDDYEMQCGRKIGELRAAISAWNAVTDQTAILARPAVVRWPVAEREALAKVICDKTAVCFAGEWDNAEDAYRRKMLDAADAALAFVRAGQGKLESEARDD